MRPGFENLAALRHPEGCPLAFDRRQFGPWEAALRRRVLSVSLERQLGSRGMTLRRLLTALNQHSHFGRRRWSL